MKSSWQVFNRGGKVMQSGFTGWNKNTFLKKRWIEIRQMYFLKDFEFVQFEQLQWTEAAHSVSNMISQPQIKRVWIKSRQTEEILMLSDRQITLHLFYERCVISNELEQKNKKNRFSLFLVKLQKFVSQHRVIVFHANRRLWTLNHQIWFLIFFHRLLWSVLWAAPGTN